MDTYRCAHNGEHPYLFSFRPDGFYRVLPDAYVDWKLGLPIAREVYLNLARKLKDSGVNSFDKAVETYEKFKSPACKSDMGPTRFVPEFYVRATRRFPAIFQCR